VLDQRAQAQIEFPQDANGCEPAPLRNPVGMTGCFPRSLIRAVSFPVHPLLIVSVPGALYLTRFLAAE
jgi:hypothetical protein